MNLRLRNTRRVRWVATCLTIGCAGAWLGSLWCFVGLFSPPPLCGVYASSGSVHFCWTRVPRTIRSPGRPGDPVGLIVEWQPRPPEPPMWWFDGDEFLNEDSTTRHTVSAPLWVAVVPLLAVTLLLWRDEGIKRRRATCDSRSRRS